MINISKVNWSLKNTKKRFLERFENSYYTNTEFEHAPLPQIWHISRLRNWISKPILCRSVTKDFVSTFVCDKTLVLFLLLTKTTKTSVSVSSIKKLITTTRELDKNVLSSVRWSWGEHTNAKTQDFFKRKQPRNVCCCSKYVGTVQSVSMWSGVVRFVLYSTQITFLTSSN